MEFDRRTMMAGAAAAALATSAIGRAAPRSPGWYRQAIIIDALGGVGDPYSPDEQLRLSEPTRSIGTTVEVLRASSRFGPVRPAGRG